MKHLLLLSLVFLNVCAVTPSIESDSSHDAVFAEFCASETSRLFPVLADTVMQDDFSPAPVISQSVGVDEGGVSIPPKKKGMCERLYEKQKARTPVKIEQQEDMYPQEEEVPVLDYHFVPEPEVAVSIKAFLDSAMLTVGAIDGPVSHRFQVWLYQVFMHDIGKSSMFTYPFCADCFGDQAFFFIDRYASEIAEVMKRLCGIFYWECEQSRGARDALPGWKPKKGEAERYPKIKKILIHWKQGPFPNSFCANIMFLMQNKARLEKLGCEMDFLDECCHYLPASLNPFMSGSLQYKEFYKYALWENPELYKKNVIRFSRIAVDAAGLPSNYYQNNLAFIKNFRERKPNAVWLCDLAEKIMIAEMILGKRPELVFSIQGLAAYINDHLECVQAHPDYLGMNTETLRFIVYAITGGKSDIGVCQNDEAEFFVDSLDVAVSPLHQKSHGLKWGIHSFVQKQGWVHIPEYYTQEDEAFHKTKAAIACLTRFGISSDVVTTLQLCMDAQGKIPSSLYHDPLTSNELNKLLASGGQERVVKNDMLNCMKRNVDRIVSEWKIVWPEGAVDYKRYQEFFAGDRAITKGDLVALEADIKEEYGGYIFKDRSPFFTIEGLYDRLHEAMIAYLEDTVCEMQEEYSDIVEGRKRLNDLRRQMELICSGQTVWREELQDLADIKETTVYQAHLEEIEEEKKALMQSCVHQVRYSKQSMQEEISYLIKTIDKLCTDFPRKREILEAFSERIISTKGDRLVREPVNMIVLFLKSLGVVTLHFAQTREEASDVIADIIDGAPWSDDPICTQDLQQGLQSLFELQV